MIVTKLGIIGAGGDLPLRVKSALEKKGQETFLVALNHIASSDTCAQANCVLSVGEVSAVVSLFQKNEVDTCVMVGPMIRPDLSSLKVDEGGQVVLTQFMQMAGAGGDDALLRCLVLYFEERGLTVIGADDVVSDFVAPLGCLTSVSSQAWHEDVAIGVALLKQLSIFDVGQGCVVRNRQVLAIEGPEGTDAMLLRVSDLNESGAISGGVLVKLPKEGQEKRVDLPTIGPVTIKNAIDARLSGVIFAQDGALLIDREECIKIADQAGVFVEGIAL